MRIPIHHSLLSGNCDIWLLNGYKERVVKGGGGGEGVTNPISQPMFLQIPLPSVQIPFPLAEFRKKKTHCYTYQLFSLGIHKITASKYQPTLSLIHQENSFQFYGKHCLQTHGRAMATKIAVAFANSSLLRLRRRF